MSRLAYSDAKAYGALVNYRGTLYREINSTLRGTAAGTPVSKEVLDDMQRGFDAVSVALPEHAVVFRGMSVPVDYSGDVRKQLMSMFPEGSEFTDKGYVSTSRNQSTASSFATKDAAGKHPVRFFITVPEGTKVMAGQPLEQEVVLNRGTRFRVVDSSVRNVRNNIGELQDMLDVSLEVLR